MELPPEMPPRLAKLPPFPAVAAKLIRLFADDEVRLPVIASCIATDPAVSGKMIKRANAADQMRYCEVRDMLRAAIALGVDRTREISLAAATSGYASSTTKPEVLGSWWHHSLASALSASDVARQCGRSPVDAYTAALFHDIGRLGLLTAYPDQYEELLAASTGPDEQAAMERERFGVDHLQAGVWLARHWNLPDFIVTAMAGQQDSSEGSLSDAVLAKTGCGLADLLGFRGLGCRNGPNVDEILRALPEWVRPRLIAQLHGLQQAIGRELACSVESSYGAAPSETPAGIAKEAEHRVAIPRRTWRDDLPRLIPIGVLLGLAATLLGVSAILFRP